MDDADDERRTLIFNTLANLPQDVLKDIGHDLGLVIPGYYAKDKDNTYILDIIRELLGIPAPPEIKVTTRRTKVERDFEDKLDHFWLDTDGNEARRIWEEAPEVGPRINDEMEDGINLDALDRWWDHLTLDEKLRVLRNAGIDPNRVAE